MTDAVARAASVPVADVRRAMMLRGSLGVVAATALAGGSVALAGFGLICCGQSYVASAEVSQGSCHFLLLAPQHK